MAIKLSIINYSLVQKEPATLVFYYINQEIEMALPSKVEAVW